MVPTRLDEVRCTAPKDGQNDGHNDNQWMDLEFAMIHQQLNLAKWDNISPP